MDTATRKAHSSRGSLRLPRPTTTDGPLECTDRCALQCAPGHIRRNEAGVVLRVLKTHAARGRCDVGDKGRLRERTGLTEEGSFRHSSSIASKYATDVPERTWSCGGSVAVARAGTAATWLPASQPRKPAAPTNPCARARAARINNITTVNAQGLRWCYSDSEPALAR